MRKSIFNGCLYSRESFDGYKTRIKLRIISSDGTHLTPHEVDIYTTETNKSTIEKSMLDITTDKVVSFEIFHWATKEQDDLASELISNFLDKF